MSIQTTAYRAEDVQFMGDSNTGEVVLYYRTGTSTAISVHLPLEVLKNTIAGLLNCSAQAPDADTRQVALLFSTRAFTFSTLGPTLVLDQELEYGPTMRRTLDVAEAKTIVQQLTECIARVEELQPGVQ